MVVKCRINEDGELVNVPVAEVRIDELTGKPVGKAKKVRAQASHREGVDDVTLAQAVVESLGKPVVFQGGSYWAFTENEGWKDCSEQLVKQAHMAKRKNANESLMPIIKSFLTVPSPTSHPEAPVYWERTGGLWRGEWVPFVLEEDEVLLTDGIHNVITGAWTPTGDRIIYGPRISLPWATESGDSPICPEFLAMIERAFPDEGIRGHFQEVMSQILQPHSVLRGQIVMWGPPGTCKTTIATAIGCAPAGYLGCSFVQEAELVKSKWTSAALVNKFANVSDDSPVVSGWPGWIKRYSSGSLSVEPKYHQPASCSATAKMISTCNQFQNTADASGAMVDRLFPFQVTNRIKGHWNSEKMTARYWSVGSRREGILAWLLEGLERLRKRGFLNPPANWLEGKDKAVGRGDPLEGWFRENLMVATDGEIDREELMGRMPPEILPKNWSHMSLLDYLERLFQVESVRKMTDGVRKKVYKGVAFVD